VSYRANASSKAAGSGAVVEFVTVFSLVPPI
jgi:hypothetical protein